MVLKELDYGSIEPLLIDDEFLGRLKKLDKVCHHFHLSLQSGCEATLKRMNRRYTPQEFKDIVHKLRDAYTDVLLTTDVIVGFPGETDEEFQETYEFLKEIRFYKMHIFKYSVRSGTKAASMENQVPSNIKDLRSKQLIQLSEENEICYNEKYVNNVVEVLIEEKENDCYLGHTANFLLVEANVLNNVDLQNQIVKVRVQKSLKDRVFGEIVT